MVIDKNLRFSGIIIGGFLFNQESSRKLNTLQRKCKNADFPFSRKAENTEARLPS